MERVVFFIDGGYINRILKTYFDAADIDYEKFCEGISNNLNLKRLRTYYYNCMPIRRKENKEDEKRYINMQKFIRNLKRLPRFEVKLGKLQVIGGQFRQKMVDLLMSLDIVDMTMNRQVKHIILLAGDADFVPAIKKAKDRGTIVHLLYHSSSVHDEMLDEADELHILNHDLIYSCKLN